MTDTKTETTIADELRDAATTLRQTATKATPGPWTSGLPSWAGSNAVLNSHGHPIAVCGDETEGADHPASADAAWIALASPLLAEALADLLNAAATTWDHQLAYSADHSALHHADPGCGRRVEQCRCLDAALGVARALNGGEVSAR